MAGLFGSDPGLSSMAFGGIIFLLGLFALLEFYEMADKRGLRPFRNLGIFIGLSLIGSVSCVLGVHEMWDFDITVEEVEIAILLFAIPFLGIAQLRLYDESHKDCIAPLASTLFGIGYVALLLNVLQKIRYFPDLEGHWLLLFFIVVSKMSDTGAYCTGQLFGKNKMIPRVSPGKTWEGFGGGIVFSVITAWMFYHFAGKHLQMPVNHALILGVLLGVGAVAGDLVESLFKREAGLKDSGRFLPGIGGVLDLLDSLLFNAPIMYFYLKYVLQS